MKKTRMTYAGRMTARVAKHFRRRNPTASKMRIPDWVSHMNARPTWSKFRQHGFALLKTCEKLRAWGGISQGLNSA